MDQETQADSNIVSLSDATGASSPPTDANNGQAQSSSPGGASSTPNDANKGAVVPDFAEQAIAALEAKHGLKKDESSTPSSDQREKAPEGDINKSNATEKADEKPVEKPADFSDVPFHKHERFQELLKERDELKRTSSEVKPLLDQQATINQFMAQNRISFAQFKDSMEIMALMNTNPTEALKRLEPVYKSLQSFKGEGELPADLKAEVDSGDLKLTRAQEIAALRKQKAFEQQQAQVNQQQSQTDMLIQALSSLNNNWKRTDPDFARKEQMVLDRFVALSANNPWRTPTEATALAQRAYSEVNERIKAFLPPPKATKAPPVNGHSGGTNKPTFTSWEQAEEMAVAHFANGRHR